MAATRKPRQDDLATYHAKRSADRTPEPSGATGATPAEGRLFVVHQHAATRLHYDLRLQMGGTLRSWAVPRGPSKNPADKRLAVNVEDHPLEYGDFEGIIPEGNYGAGAVIVWDRGEWVPIGDWREGLAKGKLLFDLKGYKLKGRWTLVKLKKTPKEWLLIKERDGQVSQAGDDFPPGSVLSGRTVEDLLHGTDLSAGLAARLKKAKAKRAAVQARDVRPMLAETRDAPFTRAGWVFELKIDGWRVIAAREQGEGKLYSRNGLDLTASFPELAKALAAMPWDGLILDGEITCHDAAGLPSFQRLQQRARNTRHHDIARAAVENPATFYTFDLIAAEGYDLRELPLVARKTVLQSIVPPAGPLKYVEHFEKEGEALYAQVERMGLEGIMGKKADSPYRMRRSSDWVKIRADRVDDFVVVGASKPKGSRTGFGALHLAQFEDGRLVYMGRAGSGFSDRMIGDVSADLERLRRKTPPCEGPVPTGKDEMWVEPELVAEVRFKERTDDGLLRQPVFLRFREDKAPGECVFKAEVTEVTEVTEGSGTPLSPPVFNFSNLQKLFWKDEGYTKGDLIDYYRQIAPWILPYLKGRCLVLTRYPDGIDGKSFYQKDAPGYAREFVRTVTVWSEDSQRELNYFVVDDEASLLYIANMAAIPLHIWGSRVASLETPDWCILDLDPKGAPFTDVVTVALACKTLCDEIGLPSFIKTSGSSGLHVLIPMGRQCTYEQTRSLGGLLARAIVADLPEITTVVRQIRKRDGKVYVDYMQNGHGQLLAAPFSVRPVRGALVSTPLAWKEVTPRLSMADYDIRTVPARMKKLKADSLAPVLDLKPDLPGALEALAERFARRKAARAKPKG